MARGKDGGRFIAGLVVGGVVGAAVALLLAPQPGRQTREQLLEEPAMLPAAARATMGRLGARGRAFLAQLRATMREAIAEGKAEAERTRHELYRRFEEEARARQR